MSISRFFPGPRRGRPQDHKRVPRAGKTVAFAAALLAGVAGGGTEAAEDGATLVVRILGLKSVQGRLSYALYAPGDAFAVESSAMRRGDLVIDGPSFSFRIEGLPLGSYALIVAHDIDGDGHIATPGLLSPWVGEPVGVSNYRGRLFGRPSFDKAKFELRAAVQELAVELFPTALF